MEKQTAQAKNIYSGVLLFVEMILLGWQLSSVRYWERKTQAMDTVSVLNGHLLSAGFALCKVSSSKVFYSPRQVVAQ